MSSEKKIIEGCQNGDRKAQFDLYQLFAGKMYVVSLRYCKAQQLAEDVLQEAFIKVFKHIKNFRNECPVEGWIKRIVINTALNQMRSKLYLFPMVDVEDSKISDHGDFSISNHSIEELLELLNELPTGCKVVFNLYAIEGYKHKEIAEMLNISEGTSKSQFARARMLFRERLNELEKISYGKAF